MDPPRWGCESVHEQKQKLLGTPPVRQQQAPWREQSLSSSALFVTPLSSECRYSGYRPSLEASGKKLDGAV